MSLFKTYMEDGERSWIYGVFILWKGGKACVVERCKGMLVER
jgi:hypothetical protein